MKKKAKMEAFIRHQNIKNFKTRLARKPLGTPEDELQRKTVPQLLAQEEIKQTKSLAQGTSFMR
jgi:hypothetical protein